MADDSVAITAVTITTASILVKRSTFFPVVPCSKHTCLLVACLLACLTSQQHVSVSQERICSDNYFTCCHTETEVAHQTFNITQSRYTATGPTSPSTDPIMPGPWQGSHWSANVVSHWYDSTQKNPGANGIRTPNMPVSRRTP